MIHGQSKLMSAAESVLNVLIGYQIAIIAQLLVFPRFGIDIPLQDNLAIGGIFTVISLARSYVLRRLFNAIEEWRFKKWLVKP